jgi:hypothetical protein
MFGRRLETDVAHQHGRTRALAVAHAAVFGVSLLATSAFAQTTQMRTAHLIEWDLPAVADSSPGAMVVDTRGDDNNRVWFVTSVGAIPKVYRLFPQKSPTKGAAQWTSWELSSDSLFAGGAKKLKATHDRRYVFVRTATSIQRIDTQSCDSASPQTCLRTEWDDQSTLNVSDLAVDDYGNVFSATADANDPVANAGLSYLQMLTPGAAPAPNTTSSATVTRWRVGGGAGFCQSSSTSPCISGIAVSPANRYLVYYAEPGANNIGELNISTNQIRRWSVSAVGASEPRQLNVDRSGLVWAVTGSGHLVRLDPSSSAMSGHPIPLTMLNDPFGVAPDDDVVGYTASGLSKVGMLIPARNTIIASPIPGSASPTPATVLVISARAPVALGAVTPQPKVVPAQVTTQPDGVYVEAQLDSGNDDMSPNGITPAKWRGQGTFFYTVGATNNPTADRIGFVRLPMVKKLKHPRDDDDTDDGCCSTSQPIGWHNSDPDDQDDDGQADEVDTPTANETVTIPDPSPVGPGQYVEYPVTASTTTLALIGMATSDDVLGQVGVEIYNSLGMLVAGTVSAPGVGTATLSLPAAGNYTVRVKNYGITGFTQSPTLVVREPWVQ